METLTLMPMRPERPRMPVEPPPVEPRPVVARSPLLPAFALAERLEVLSGLVERVSDADYVSQPAPCASSPIGVTPAGASQIGVGPIRENPVGATVRRCVDRVLALLDRPAGEVLTYDDSDRQSRGRRAIECDRREAMATLRRLAERIRHMAPRTSDVPIIVDTPLDRLGTRTRLRSSLGRELIFVLQEVSAAERVTEARCAS